MGGCAARRCKQHVPILRLLCVLLSEQCWRIFWRCHHKPAQHGRAHTVVGAGVRLTEVEGVLGWTVGLALGAEGCRRQLALKVAAPRQRCTRST